jgi:hypothetical protein
VSAACVGVLVESCLCWRGTTECSNKFELERQALALVSTYSVALRAFAAA